MGATGTSVENAERAVEFLVAESLAASKPFFAWFVRSFLEESAPGAMPTEGAVFFQAGRATATHGHAIEVVLKFGEGRCAVVIAVATFPTRSLAEAARAAAEESRKRHDASTCRTILLVPGGRSRAGEAAAGFDGVGGLLETQEVFDAGAAAATGEMGAHLAFQRALFRDAVETLVAATDSDRTPSAGAEGDFRTAYFALVGRVAPQLRSRAAASADEPIDTVVFDEDVLPKWGFMPRPRLAHHLRSGAATLLIDGWGADIESLATIMDPAFAGTEYKLAVAPARFGDGRAAAMIIARAPSLDPDKPFGPQADDARIAIETTLGLRNWFARRQTAARYWAEHVDPSCFGGGNSRISRDAGLV